MLGEFAHLTTIVAIVASFALEHVISLDFAADAKLDVISGSENFWPPEQARAAVFSEQERKFPQGRATQAVELLRFISAYKHNVEALVDITPYSALLRAASDDDGELNFYAFIDTWVGNATQTEKPIVSMQGKNGTCLPKTKSVMPHVGDGEGFQVDVNLVFWPEPTGFVDTRPRESVTVSSGWYGSYGFGTIAVHEGTLIDGATGVLLEPDADFTSAMDAEVYPCPQGKHDLQNGVKMGNLAKQAHRSKDNKEALSGIEADLYKELKKQAVDRVKMTGSDPEKMEVQIEYDPEQMFVEKDMPVFFETEDIEELPEQLQQEVGPPLLPAGKIVAAADGKATVKMSSQCLPSEATNWLPRLKMPKAANALERAKTLSGSIADSISTTGVVPTTKGSADEDEVDDMELLQEEVSRDNFKPFLVCAQGEAFRPMHRIGRLALNLSNAVAEDCDPKKPVLLQTSAAVKKHGNTGGDSTVNATVTSNSQMPIIHTGKAGPNPATILANAKEAVNGGTTAGASSGGKALKTAKAIVSGNAPTTKALSNLAGEVKDGDKVCVLTRRATGRVFERSFAMPDFSKQDSVLLQFSSTGHGWSQSTEQCGEFCHVIYHFKINGQSAVHVTEWRTDCANNPISRQFGTWELPRDGWCPGSVEPGLYIDVSKWMKEGENVFTVDVDVWSSKNNRYEAYTNYGGFFGGDPANLFVGASFFVYDKTAVDAIKRQAQPFTAAEKALVQGCNMPEALQPPKEVRPDFGSFLQQSLTSEALEEMEAQQGFASTRKQTGPKTNLLQQGSPRNRVERDNSPSNRYDFESKAPWYLYSEEEDGLPGKADGATVVPVFNDNLIQINSREIFINVKRDLLPQQWAQAAMHIRLETPTAAHDGAEIDHWDRLGSTGLLFKASTQKVQLHPALTPSEGKKMKMTL